MSKILLFANTDWFLYNFRLAGAEGARAQGHEVVLVSPPGEYAERLRAKGFRWVEMPMDRRGINPLRELGTVLRLRELYAQEKPDLVHHFTIKCVLYGTLAARWAGVRSIANSLTGLGYIFTGRRKLLSWLAGLGYRLLLRGSATIFENPSDQEMFLRRGWIDPKRSAVILGAGVDTPHFSPQPLAEGTPCVILPARMLWDKGVGDFVEAARLLRGQGKQARFILVGESDPGNPTGIPLAVLDGWQREGAVEWWGWREDMRAVYAAAHIICMPSYREGLSRTLAEAAASGRAIVTTDVPGCRDAVIDGESGLLVPPADLQALAGAIGCLLDDAGLRGRMGAQGRAFALEKFDAEQIVAQTLEFYQPLLKQ